MNAREDDVHCNGTLLTHIQLSSEQKTSKSFMINLVSRMVAPACNDAQGCFLPSPRVPIMPPEFAVVLLLLFITVSPSCPSSLVLTSLSPSLVLNTNILILNCAGPLNSPEAKHIHTAARQPLNHLPSAIHASNLTALRGFIYQPVHQNGLHLKNLATKVVLWQMHHKLYFSKWHSLLFKVNHFMTPEIKIPQQNLVSANPLLFMGLKTIAMRTLSIAFHMTIVKLTDPQLPGSSSLSFLSSYHWEPSLITVPLQTWYLSSLNPVWWTLAAVVLFVKMATDCYHKCEY